MFLSPEQKAKRDRRSKIRRRPFGGISEADVIGIFPHQGINADVVTIREHKGEIEGKNTIMYSVKTTETSDNVIQIGTELNSMEEGFDYVVAVVNNHTGETEYRPARLFQFEAKHTADKAITLGAKRKAPVDYSADHGLDSTQWAEKRTQLTKAFGSSMKQKIQQAAVRRAVKQDVLDTMVQTSFASATVISDKKDIKMDDISLLQKPESSILPPPVTTANVIPHNIYPLSLFITNEEVEQFKDTAEGLLTNSKSKLVEDGWPDIAFMICRDFSNYKGAKAVGFVLLACQAYIFTITSKSRQIVAKAFESTPFPYEFTSKVQADYLPTGYDTGASKKAVARLILSAEQRDRFAAYTLALALTLSPNCAIPVTPWQSVIQGFSSKQMEKLLVALGCTLGGGSAEEALASKSIQFARLTKPPQDKKFKRVTRN